MATYHFAPTWNNRWNLLSEGIPDSRIFVTGNTIVDSLEKVLAKDNACSGVDSILAETAGLKRIVLTMHRRENIPQFEPAFLALRRFVDANQDFCIVFPMHPNPAVRRAAEVLRGAARLFGVHPPATSGVDCDHGFRWNSGRSADARENGFVVPSKD